jgi:hypothetical protein
VDANGCSATADGTATITVKPPAAVGVVATAVTITQVSVAWSYYGSADRFRIYRNGSYLAETTASSWNDSGAQPSTAYRYWVVAEKNQTVSDPSAADLATTVIFEDDPLKAAVDVVEAAHVLQLRTAINAVRIAAGLPLVTFPALEAWLTASDIEGLRVPLNDARVLLGLPRATYGPPIVPGMSIDESAIMELRRGVQ